MERDQHASSNPQKDNPSVNEVQVDSASKKARRRKDRGAHNKPKKHIEDAASVLPQQSTGESSSQEDITSRPNQELQRNENETQLLHDAWQNARRVGFVFVCPIPSPMRPERRSPQRRQGRRDQSPSPKKRS